MRIFLGFIVCVFILAMIGEKDWWKILLYSLFIYGKSNGGKFVGNKKKNKRIKKGK